MADHDIISSFSLDIFSFHLSRSAVYQATFYKTHLPSKSFLSSSSFLRKENNDNTISRVLDHTCMNAYICLVTTRGRKKILDYYSIACQPTYDFIRTLNHWRLYVLHTSESVPTKIYTKTTRCEKLLWGMDSSFYKRLVTVRLRIFWMILLVTLDHCQSKCFECLNIFLVANISKVVPLRIPE